MKDPNFKIFLTVRLTEKIDTKSHDGRHELPLIIFLNELEGHAELLCGQKCGLHWFGPLPRATLTGLVGAFGQLGVVPNAKKKRVTLKMP